MGMCRAYSYTKFTTEVRQVYRVYGKEGENITVMRFVIIVYIPEQQQ